MIPVRFLSVLIRSIWVFALALSLVVGCTTVIDPLGPHREECFTGEGTWVETANHWWCYRPNESSVLDSPAGRNPGS